MKIACIGWGSLIWKPEGLPTQSKWFEDGPILPIEFTRQSSDDRITLIIDRQARPVRTLWAFMTTTNLEEAIEALRKREGAKKEDIHHVTTEVDDTSDIKGEILRWIKIIGLDAAIWTGLSFSDKTRKQRPSIDYVLNHLKGLEYSKRKYAEEYIRKAPRQIDTEYRRQIEDIFHWTTTE